MHLDWEDLESCWEFGHPSQEQTGLVAYRMMNSIDWFTLSASCTRNVKS